MNIIHPTAIVEKSVSIGDNNYIGPYCYITGNTKIGNNNRFEAYCSIGTPAEHRDFISQSGKTEIGDNNIFREFVTINSGTKDVTIVKNRILMLRNSHIGHDSIVEDKVNISCNVLIGGHSYLMTGSNFGLGSICHQFSIIGAYSMIGMGTIITKKSKITPGNIYIGNPAKYLRVNEVGLNRNKIDESKLIELIKEFEIKYAADRN